MHLELEYLQKNPTHPPFEIFTLASKFSFCFEDMEKSAIQCSISQELDDLED
jgi:hypothetical protein